ncbi:RagB/SusD family nutrient uptake outer membrane protein [Pontibacter sp. E15-1]|uniref:RagB/SusD family nutrient uptake outer membrane protein n=1 Tax=Pontibacter sp. E15-1 TaxID=2919918 RepID=UPI001F50096F|nr:RagB/SusD family nutrient uptake outer membrane protein [Pontibacter sp. E15-1]MCJ8164301.1 RagB/SusD family nutrient uptake outer membrane protein [Pontibacter sp. E15-1]
MRYLKNRLVLVAISGMVALASCEKDFLEKPESSDVTVDEIFSEKLKAESFLWETYSSTVPLGFPVDWGRHHGMYASMLMAASDEGDYESSWVGANNHNTGNVSTGYNGEDDFGYHYKGIRDANIFLQNIDKVPDISKAEKQRLQAEAKFLRALQYHELMKRYGAIPLVDTVLTVAGEIKLPRNTYEECVNFIVKSCDEAVMVLPDAYPANYTGRITKGAALALKGRALLYAASPLHNTGSPYLEGNEELTGYGNYDLARWQRAADANKAVLNWAESAGVSLVTASADPKENYRNAIEKQNNSELILVNQSQGWWGAWWPMFGQFAMPRGIYGGWTGHGVTYQQAQQYYTADGTNQVWPETGPRGEFQEKMEQMEPRFQYSVLYSGAKWNDEVGNRNFYKTKDGAWFGGAPVNGVGFMRKFLTSANWGGGQFNWIIFRLAEFYLNYAEAQNEVSPLAPEVYEAVNVIRRRAGIPEISPSDERYDTQEELRQAIWRERAVELAFEEHRFFDVRRWMIAGQEGVMRGQFTSLNLYEQGDGTFIYKKEPFETRVWADKLYLYPIPQDEIDKGYIKQNPGW